MIRLAECTWPKAQQLARDERALVILPLGAVEQHGPHLPLPSTGWAPRSSRGASRRI